MRPLFFLLLFPLLIFASNGKKLGESLNTFSIAPNLISGYDYLPNTIIFKLKPQFRNSLNTPSTIKLFNELNIKNITKLFPNHNPPETPTNALNQKLVDISLIYESTNAGSVPLTKAINKLLHTGLFEYVEPKYIQHLLYKQNDPDSVNAGQYFIKKIKCPEAWDIEKGDTSIVIGIIDTGSDLDHPDLKANLKHNYADPIDSVDNDNDGFKDNFSGWDLGMNDNDPTTEGNFHGSHVSGCANATTDNGVGVSSPSGIKCKFMPVKISVASGTLTKGYEGITYAADHGCSVINCSWGGAGAGQLGQDIINYVTINKGAIVFCGAGNNNDNTSFYPAAYEYAIAVGSTDVLDRKSSFSNYGSYVDFCAPGTNIYSTYFNDNYTSSSGTSMASPIAAGAAAIVKSHFKSLTGLQVAEKLRVTADNIDAVSGNSGYKDKLGSGRINLFRALTETTPSIRYQNIKISDNNDMVFVVNDTLYITGDFINYLDPSSSALTATLSCSSPDINVVNANFTIGTLNTLATTNNNNSAFKAVIKPTAPLNSKVTFKVTFTDGAYTSFQAFDAIVNVDYINIGVNDIRTTITSKGLTGYNLASQGQGIGFLYNDSNLLYEASLMVGVSSGNVSDWFRGSPSTDMDFVSVSAVKQETTPTVSDVDLHGTFDDSGNSNPLKVKIDHSTYAWSSIYDRKYVMLLYTIHNNGTDTLKDLYAGIAADWDVQNSAKNKGDYDSTNRMGYVYCTYPNTGLYAGIKLLSNTPPVHYAIDNENNPPSGINIYDGFDGIEKYTTLSTNRKQAGAQDPDGIDVIDVMSTGPFTLLPTDSVLVAFALIGGNNIGDLQGSANAAQYMYDHHVVSVPTINKSETSIKLFPNPTNSNSTLIINAVAQNKLSIEITDVSGRTVFYTPNTTINAGTNFIPLKTDAFSNGIYFIRVSTNENSNTLKLIIER